MKYKGMLVTSRSGMDALQVAEFDLRQPAQGEARLRVLATPVVQDDIAARIGNRPWLPEVPFVPGYSFLGIVDALGAGVGNVTVGDRVVALTQTGSHSEYIYWKAEELVPVPEDLDPAKAVVLVLNYLVAYQILHRVARVKPQDKVLIVGASGGVGTAFLELGRLAGLKMYGLASPAKHAILAEYGAIPIDYHNQDFADVIRKAEPGGIDYVFNGMFNAYVRRSMSILKRGGALVQYGAPQAKPDFWRFLAEFAFYNLLPNGKSIKGYGTHRLGVHLFAEDWGKLFGLLGEGKLAPMIAETFSLLEAKQAYALLENGGVVGTIVLLVPELL
jgi:NADPH:quinone reductase-like Zn-dependent oxidoreductase